MKSLPNDQITQYLLRTLPVPEADAFEDRMMAEDDLLAETQAREHDLIDLYVSGGLSRDKLLMEAFELALAGDPSRREKVANARALARHIEATRVPARAADASANRGSWVSWFSAPRLAFGSLLIALAALSTVLYLDNRRVSNELARLEAVPQQPQQQVDQQAIDSERAVMADLTRDLDRERERSGRLEREITALRSSNSKLSTPEPRQEIIRSVTLRPDRTERQITSTSTAAGPKRTSVLIALPAGTPPDVRVSIRLNGRSIKQNVAAVTDPAGTAAVSVTIADAELSSGENILTIHDDGGRELAKYILKVSP